MKHILEYLLGKNIKQNKFEPLHAEMTYKEVKEDFKKYGFNIEVVDEYQDFAKTNIDENVFLGYEIKGETFPSNRARFLVNTTTMFLLEFEENKIRAVSKKELHHNKWGYDEWVVTYRLGGPADYIKKCIDEINECFK